MSKNVDLIISAILALVLAYFLTGCGFGGGNKDWVNHQFQGSTAEYNQAFNSAYKICGDFAFKEGIAIDGVTYYDEDSARAADRDYRLARLGVYPRPVAPHEGQLSYFYDRKYKCLGEKGWYWQTVEE